MRPPARPPGASGIACVALFGALLLLPAPARAGEGDYRVGVEEWMGLSKLAVLARAAGYEVEPLASLDWRDLGEGDVLFLLYPRATLEPAHVASFVRRGGRLLLADDFGRAGEAFARLGLLRRPARGVRAARFHENHPALPVARAFDTTHPLAQGVAELYTNHPAVFQVERDAEVVFGFGAGEALVVAGGLGEGRFVAIADPSVLINGMLAFEENLLFAANLLAYLRPAGPTTPRLIILAGEFALKGAPPDTLEEPRPGGSTNQVLGDFGHFLDELNDYLASEAALRALAVFGAALVLLVCGGAILLPRRDLGRETFTRVGDEAAFEGETDRARYDRRGRGAAGSFAWPAALLREAIDARLAELCDAPDPLGTLSLAAIEARVLRRAGKTAAAAARRLLPSAAALPTRAQAAAWGAPFVSRRTFVRVHEEAEAFFRVLSAEPPRSGGPWG